MIRVRRDSSTRPEGFEALSSALGGELASALRADPELTPTEFWSRVRPRLRRAAEHLAAVFSAKCAFCESQMRHVSNPHIEHYRPKSRPEFLKLIFNWENWLLSCGKCNEAKWRHFPICGPDPCLLDPTVDDPAQHVAFVGSQIVATSQRGEETVQMLKLDRSPLEDQRETWLASINALILLLLGPARPEARQLLIWSMQENAPFSAMTRAHLLREVPRLANPAVPHPRIQVEEPRERIKALIAAHIDDIRSVQ